MVAGSFAQEVIPPTVADGYRFRNDLVKYESVDNLGLTPESVAPATPFVFPRPCPASPFNLALPEGKGGKPGTLRRRRIPVQFSEEAGTARGMAALRFGFPLPCGGIFDGKHVILKRTDGKPVPAQYAVTARWPDGSVKWVLIEAHLALAAGEKADLVVEAGEEVSRAETPASPLRLTEDAGAFMVVTGPLKVVVDKRRFNLIRAAWCDADGNGRFDEAEKALQGGAFGVWMERPDGVPFATALRPPDSVAVEEQGPECIVLRIKGHYGDDRGNPWMSYVTRLFFQAGSPRVTVMHTHLDDDLSHEFADFGSLNFKLVPPRTIASVTADLDQKEGRKTISDKTLSLFQADDQKSVWQVGGVSYAGAKSSGVVSVSFDSGGAAGLVVQDFWQRWPKGLDVRGDGITVGLLPKLPSKTFGTDLPYYLMYPFVAGNYRMKWGMSFTERFTIDFSGKASREELLADAEKPVIAILPAAWYEETGALGAIVATNGKQYSLWDEFVATSYRAHMNLSAAQREYGFFNYGDWFGERVRNWGNNEYDLAHCFFQQFARTGITDYYRLAWLAARHQADTDIVHAYPDAYYRGANHQHSVGHTGTWEGPKIPAQATWSHRYDDHTDAQNGHTWSDGMVEAWMLAGDARVMDAALEEGEHITWAMSPRFAALGTHERSAGWSLKAVLGVYRAVPDPAYLKAAAHIAEVAIKSQTVDNGGAWAHKLPPDHSPDRAIGNNLFLIGILMSSLAEYHEMSGDPAAFDSLKAAGAWLVHAWNEGKATWPYSAAPDGTPTYPDYSFSVALNPLVVNGLAYIGMKTGNAEYMRIVDRALGRTFAFRGAEPSGKSLAEAMTFTADTLARLASYYGKADPARAASLLSLDGFDSYMHGIPAGERHSLRGPTKRVYYVQLKTDSAKLVAERAPIGAARPSRTEGTLSLYDNEGNVVSATPFLAADFKSFSLELRGGAGKVFKVVADDDVTAVWSLSSPDCRIVFEATEEVRIGSVGLERLSFRAPERGKTVSIQLRGMHEGSYGGALLSPDGKVVAVARGITRWTDAPQMGGMPQGGATISLTFTMPATGGGGVYNLALWAAGDIGIRIAGASPYLALSPQDWFDPKAGNAP